MKVEITEDYTLTIGVDYWSALIIIGIGLALVAFNHTFKHFIRRY